MVFPNGLETTCYKMISLDFTVKKKARGTLFGPHHYKNTVANVNIDAQYETL